MDRDDFVFAVVAAIFIACMAVAFVFVITADINYQKERSAFCQSAGMEYLYMDDLDSEACIKITDNEIKEARPIETIYLDGMFSERRFVFKNDPKIY